MSDSPQDGASYLKGEFLERIAHELRGPAGVMLGVLDELEFAMTTDPARVVELLRMARRSTRRLLRTAERLQHAAQLDSGEVQWQRDPHDLRELVRTAVENAERIEARKGIQVQLTLPEAPCLALVDAPWLNAAILELVSNAIRNARTSVRISLASNSESAGFELIFADDGAGFAGPITPRFSPPPRRQGLGLSLALVEDVVRGHEGKLTFESPTEPEARGTRVHITIAGPGR
ncbi:MAG TPA: HAMP domain-containing sensor histidine kinase [Polyangiaceae bacterium]|nr:HAMP domain-containing sensor histidine kinase [Polyangiaceae bacterium]